MPRKWAQIDHVPLAKFGIIRQRKTSRPNAAYGFLSQVVPLKFVLCNNKIINPDIKTHGHVRMFALLIT